MLHWALACILYASTLSIADCGYSKSVKPLIIALPLRIQASSSYKIPIHQPNEDESEEEPYQREQRFIPRTTYNPAKEMQYTQSPEEEEEDENDNGNQQNLNLQVNQAPFLTWNPAHKMMVLQINDYIGARNEENSQSEEENEKQEEPRFSKPRQNWGYQGSFDFEDAKLPTNSKDSPKSSKRSPKKKKKNVAKNFSSEDSDSGIYGTDPVVHFLKNKGKNNETPFDFGDMPYDNNDDFNFKDWWQY